ncbi:FUSC family protein [Janthinobacterium sp. HLX7-2]|uniref:FUSC family protein n=1 Tax=Janthinobacterium sp. HLX7-2 TaxID=1259331 RepID=UPI003F23ED34
MAELGKLARFQALLTEELRQLMTVQASDRVWQMPFAAALASGLPLLIAAYFDRLTYGLVASIGALVFLYLPSTPLSHRMVSLMACSFGMIACYTLGLMSHLYPPSMMPVIVFIAILVTMVCRFYNIGPPSSLFFIMAAAIGAYSPIALPQLPLMVGIFTMGCLLACLVGFVYSVYMLRRHAPKPVPHLQAPTFDYVVLDAVIIGIAVGVSLAAAQLLHLEKAYWVPVSCMAVIQGASLRAVWTKQLHRLIGTVIGLLLSWGLLSLPLNQWSLSITMMVLTFLIELIVVRHYAFAVILITPLTILLAEAATLGHGSPSLLIQARFIDTMLGCAIGLAGAVCLHSPGFRAAAGELLRRLIRLPPIP